MERPHLHLSDWLSEGMAGNDANVGSLFVESSSLVKPIASGANARCLLAVKRGAHQDLLGAGVLHPGQQCRADQGSSGQLVPALQGHLARQVPALYVFRHDRHQSALGGTAVLVGHRVRNDCVDQLLGERSGVSSSCCAIQGSLSGAMQRCPVLRDRKSLPKRGSERHRHKLLGRVLHKHGAHDQLTELAPVASRTAFSPLPHTVVFFGLVVGLSDNLEFLACFLVQGDNLLVLLFTRNTRLANHILFLLVLLQDVVSDGLTVVKVIQAERTTVLI